MSLKSRIEKLERQAAPYDMPPFSIEQDEPRAPVRCDVGSIINWRIERTPLALMEGKRCFRLD